MGRRRRRFAQLYDDDSADEVAQAKPLSGGGGASKEDVKKNREEAMPRERDEEEERGEETPQTRRRGRGRPPTRRAPEGDKEVAAEPVEPKAMRRDEEEERRVETPQTRRRGRGRPPTRRTPESGKEVAAEPVGQREEEAEERREETPQTRRRGRGRPPKRRAPESDKEAAAEPVEQQQKRQDEAPPVAEPVKQQQEEKEAVEVEHTAAVPIGDPVTVTGRRRKKQKKHYASFEYNGLTFELEDSVLIAPEHSSQKPYAAIIKDITEAEGRLTVTGQWFYRPEEAEIGEGKLCVAHNTRELYYSFHIDDVPAESVMHRCAVHFIPQNKQIPARKQHPGFIVQKVYGAVEKKLWNLIDKGFEDHGQEEIDILLKKTMDRIGELPDLEPEDTPSDSTDRLSHKRSLHNKDVNPVGVTREPPARKPENFEKAETPESAKPKNFAILARYKAITGNEYRDKWLDKLLESIPLAWSKEIAARVLRSDPSAATKSSSNLSSPKITGSDDNEKSYGLDDVVPIIVALESSAYEALGTDFGKYNQKLRQLWYNIKNSSKLRTRLMEKEIDPPALLKMSPDELKVGLISAEKTSEPEQPRQLQMIDGRCQRCQEKKVGISDIIQAGHRDRYQLECTSCGQTWFSSYDAVSSLSADGPCTATGTGNAAAGATAARARAAALEKKKQRAKSRSRLVRSETKSSKLEAIPEDNSL